MPHIELSAYRNYNVEQLKISVEVDFSKEYFNSGKAEAKLKEIQDDLEQVMRKYFLEYESDRWLYNHHYNRQRHPD